MTIKLLKFPYLVTSKIFGMLSISELINMSFVSKKMWNILHQFLSRKNAEQYKLCVRLTDHVIFKLCYPVANNFGRWSEDKPGKNIDKLLLPQIVELFNNPETCYEISDLFPEMESEIDFVQRLNLRIDEVIVRRNIPDQRTFNMLFKLCMTSLKVHIHSKIPDNLNFNIESYQPFRVCQLEIYDAHWVTPNVVTVLFPNCKTIRLYKNRWNTDMVTEFLENWIRGSKLKRCRFYCNVDSMVEVLKDIPVFPVNPVPLDNSPLNLYGDAQIYQIQQNDGTVGQLMYDEELRWIALNAYDQL